MICQVEGCTDHYGCRLRAKGLQVSPAVTPTRTQKPTTENRTLGNSWERGIATDERGLPINGAKGPMGVKELADNRKTVESRLKEVRDPAYWAGRSPAPV